MLERGRRLERHRIRTRTTDRGLVVPRGGLSVAASSGPWFVTGRPRSFWADSPVTRSCIAAPGVRRQRGNVVRDPRLGSWRAGGRPPTSGAGAPAPSRSFTDFFLTSAGAGTAREAGASRAGVGRVGHAPEAAVR